MHINCSRAGMERSSPWLGKLWEGVHQPWRHVRAAAPSLPAADLPGPGPPPTSNSLTKGENNQQKFSWLFELVPAPAAVSGGRLGAFHKPQCTEEYLEPHKYTLGMEEKGFKSQL